MGKQATFMWVARHAQFGRINQIDPDDRAVVHEFRKEVAGALRVLAHDGYLFKEDVREIVRVLERR